MTVRAIYRILFSLIFMRENLICQELINYTPDSHIRSITHLSKNIRFIYGLDNQSIDYYKTIDKKHSIFYNLETETISLKDDETNLIIDRLQLFNIKGINHNERTLEKLNSTIKVNFKGINTCTFGTIKQITNTLFNYGLVRTKNGISLLQIRVDTLNYKLLYELIPCYNNMFSYFLKKNKKDSVFSFSLFEGSSHQIISFKNDKIINCNANPIKINGKYDFTESVFISNKFNSLVKFRTLNGIILDVLSNDTILTINKNSGDLYYYSSGYELLSVRKINIDSSLKKMELIQKEILIDKFTATKFIHLKLKKDSLIDVFYDLNDLTKYVYKITSALWLNNIDIRNNSILLEIIHPLDKHIYIYELITKINIKTVNTVSLLIRYQTVFNNVNKKESFCGRSPRSLFYDKLFKNSKTYITDSYEKLDKKRAGMLMELSDTVLEVNQETLEQLIKSICNYVNSKQQLGVISKLFIYKINSEDTLINKIIDEHNYDILKKGVNDIAEQLTKITDIPKQDYSKDNYEVDLCTSDGSILTFIKLKRKWYATASYYKKMD